MVLNHHEAEAMIKEANSYKPIIESKFSPGKKHRKENSGNLLEPPPVDSQNILSPGRSDAGDSPLKSKQRMLQGSIKTAVASVLNQIILNSRPKRLTYRGEIDERQEI